MSQQAQAKLTNRTSSPNQNGASICTVTCPKCNHSRTVSYGGWSALACVCGVELTRFAAKAVLAPLKASMTYNGRFKLHRKLRNQLRDVELTIFGIKYCIDDPEICADHGFQYLTQRMTDEQGQAAALRQQILEVQQQIDQMR